MNTLKIFKKEYQRTGYNEGDIQAQEFMEICATYNDNGKLTREERYNLIFDTFFFKNHSKCQ